jgi:hypothetical protein
MRLILLICSKSLSAIAGHITGSHWSGPVFFGLKTPAAKKVTA